MNTVVNKRYTQFIFTKSIRPTLKRFYLVQLISWEIYFNYEWHIFISLIKYVKTLLIDWNKKQLVEKKITCLINNYLRAKKVRWVFMMKAYILRLKFFHKRFACHCTLIRRDPLSLQASKRESAWTVSLYCNSCLEYSYSPIVWIYIVICIDLP